MCPNSFMGCSCTFPLSQLAAHLQTCPFSDTSRASERSQRTDAQLKAQKSAEQERARRRSLERVVDHLEALVAAADAEPGEDEDASYDGDDGVGD